MALADYNGWIGTVREARNPQFYDALRKGHLPKLRGAHCYACGISHADAGLSHHSEEYGPTMDDYIAHTVPLCYRCHVLIHSRFSRPNRWNRYLSRLRGGNVLTPLPSMNAGFKRIFAKPDIAYFPAVDSGIAYLDNMARVRYSGQVKIATRWVIDHDTGEIIGEEPDPIAYPGGVPDVTIEYVPRSITPLCPR